MIKNEIIIKSHSQNNPINTIFNSQKKQQGENILKKLDAPKVISHIGEEIKKKHPKGQKWSLEEDIAFFGVLQGKKTLLEIYDKWNEVREIRGYPFRNIRYIQNMQKKFKPSEGKNTTARNLKRCHKVNTHTLEQPETKKTKDISKKNKIALNLHSNSPTINNTLSPITNKELDDLRKKVPSMEVIVPNSTNTRTDLS